MVMPLAADLSSTESSGFDVEGKMVQIEETNVGIALAKARLGDKKIDHFSLQKSVKIKRVGYMDHLFW